LAPLGLNNLSPPPVAAEATTLINAVIRKIATSRTVFFMTPIPRIAKLLHGLSFFSLLHSYYTIRKNEEAELAVFL
jgi:hypothetical protein